MTETTTTTIETERHSTMKLMFGYCSAWQRLANNKLTEVDSIFDCVTSIRGGKYMGDRYAQSRFWKIMSQRIWQYDDFTFDGVAAASYLMNAHRFKVWLNPKEFYELLMMSVIRGETDTPIKSTVDTKKPKDGKNKKAEIPDKLKEDWDKIINGIATPHDEALRKHGWNKDLWKLLNECVTNKGWTFKAWVEWTNAIINNQYISQNLESVIIHEFMHIIWQHLSRVDERDHFQWNLATDYAINQTCNFTDEISKVCITKHNKQFFRRLVYGIVMYLMINDSAIRTDIKENFKITLETKFDEVTPKIIDQLYTSYLTEQKDWRKEDAYANKSADFYYRVLLESCVFVSSSEAGSGYDNHDKWNDEGTDSQEGVGDMDGASPDSKGTKGAADGTEECKMADGGDPKFHSADDKIRGKGGRNEHTGFHNMEMAAARQEVKQSVKEALERCGVNIDDPSEIEKALKAIPALSHIGAHIMEWFKIHKKNWKQLLKKEMTSFINPHDYDITMSRENRAIPGSFPGKKRDRGLDVVIQMDTSGSINYKDWNDFCGQVEEIGRSCDSNMIRVMQVHSVIASDEQVNLRKIKKMKIKETGGTTMQLGPAKLAGEKNKKLLIIFTDGYIDTFFQKDYNFKIIMFLSRGNSHLAESLSSRGFRVLCQDEE